MSTILVNKNLTTAHLSFDAQMLLLFILSVADEYGRFKMDDVYKRSGLEHSELEVPLIMLIGGGFFDDEEDRLVFPNETGEYLFDL